MTLRLKASKHIGNGFPPKEGKKLDQCLDTATCKKNWPIWLDAFKDDPPMLKRLRDAQQQLSNLQDK